MTEFVKYTVQGEVAVIAMDKAPINGLGAALRAGIAAALARAYADQTIKAIVLIGTPRAFSGGADITEFGTPKASQEPHLRTVLDSIENSTKPVVAAISGFC